MHASYSQTTNTVHQSVCASEAISILPSTCKRPQDNIARRIVIGRAMVGVPSEGLSIYCQHCHTLPTLLHRNSDTTHHQHLPHLANTHTPASTATHLRHSPHLVNTYTPVTITSPWKHYNTLPSLSHFTNASMHFQYWHSEPIYFSTIQTLKHCTLTWQLLSRLSYRH